MSTTQPAAAKPAAKLRTDKEITAAFAATLHSATGATVEVVIRAKYLWTFVGAPADVAAAVQFVRATGLMNLERPIEFDEELGESFAFLDDRVHGK